MLIPSPVVTKSVGCCRERRYRCCPAAATSATSTDDDDDDDDDDGHNERETEREYDRKSTATKASSSLEPSTRHSMGLLTDLIATLLAQLKSRDMVNWTQENWREFRANLRSLTSLVNDVLGRPRMSSIQT
jgi:hypothetical protein